MKAQNIDSANKIILLLSMEHLSIMNIELLLLPFNHSYFYFNVFVLNLRSVAICGVVK